VKASSPAATPVHQQPKERDRKSGERQPEARGFPRRDAPPRNRAHGRPRHHGVDVGVVPHVERAGGAGADRNAQERDKPDQRMQVSRRNHQPDQRGEDDERHHPRLQEREIIAGGRLADQARRSERGVTTIISGPKYRS